MTALTFILSIIALVIAIVAFRRTGGMAEIKDQVDSMDSVTDSLREKTANAFEKMEKALRKADKEENLEEKKQEKSETEGDT